MEQEQPASLWRNAVDENGHPLSPEVYKEGLMKIYGASPELMVRDGEWSELVDEQRVVRSFYKEQGQPVPLATERRFSKQVAQFKERWQIEKPGRTMEQWKVMDGADLNYPSQSWQELMISHNLVTHHYAIAGLQVPEATVKRQLSEVEDFDREMTAHRMDRDIREMEAGHPSPSQASEDFKKQLQQIRERQGPTLKPR